MIDYDLIAKRAPSLRYKRAVKMENGSERHTTWDGKRTYYTWDGVIGGLTVHASGDTADDAFRNAILFAEVVNASIRM